MFPVHMILLADGHLMNFCTIFFDAKLTTKNVFWLWMNVILKFECNSLCNSEYKSNKTWPIWVDNFDYQIFSMSKGSFKKVWYVCNGWYVDFKQKTCKKYALLSSYFWSFIQSETNHTIVIYHIVLSITKLEYVK